MSEISAEELSLANAHLADIEAALREDNERLTALLQTAEQERDANMAAAVTAARECESLRVQLAAALETAASEKARADRGDAIMQSAALAVPAELIAVRAAIVRKQQEAAQAAADAAAAELARLGTDDARP